MAKRIATVAFTHFPSDARPRREARALVDRGDEVHFWGLGTGGDYELDGVSVHELPVRRYRGGNRGRYLAAYGSFLTQAAIELARAPVPDVVHVHTLPDFMVFAALFPKLRGARILLDIHDPMPELYRSKFHLGPHHPVIRAVEWQERSALHFADHLICTHDLFRERLVTLGVPRERITVLLNVADPAVFGPPGALTDGRMPSDPPTIVYHGTIAERLGLDVALEAFDRLRRTHRRLRLRLIGTGDFAPRLRELIDRSANGDAVDFPDRHLPVHALPEAIGDATVGLVPNRNDPSTRLMLPVKLMEYAHVGIPAVAPRLPAITQYFDERRCRLYRSGDSESLASALGELLSDPELRARQRGAALELARAVAWVRMREDLYAAVDGRHSPRTHARPRVVHRSA